MSSQVRFWSPRWLQEGFFGPLEDIFWPSWGHVWAILCDLGAIKMSISSRRNAHFWKKRFHLRYKRLIIRHKQQCRYHYHVKMRLAKNTVKTMVWKRFWGFCLGNPPLILPLLRSFWCSWGLVGLARFRANASYRVLVSNERFQPLICGAFSLNHLKLCPKNQLSIFEPFSH